MTKELNSPLRHSVEVLLGLPEMSIGIQPDGTRISTGVFNPREPAEVPEIASQIETLAHWAPRLKITKEQSYGSFHNLEMSPYGSDWLHIVHNYAKKYASFHGLTDREYFEKVMKDNKFPDASNPYNVVLVDPNVPIRALVPNTEELWNGEDLDKTINVVDVPKDPYIAYYSYMDSPDEDLPKDDDGFRRYPHGRTPNPYISQNYALKHIPEGMRGATLHEILFMKQNGNPRLSTFFALGSRLDGQIPSTRDGISLGNEKDLDLANFSFEFPIISTT